MKIIFQDLAAWRRGILSDGQLDRVIVALGDCSSVLCALREEGSALRYVNSELQSAINMRAMRRREL